MLFVIIAILLYIQSISHYIIGIIDDEECCFDDGFSCGLIATIMTLFPLHNANIIVYFFFTMLCIVQLIPISFCFKKDYKGKYAIKDNHKFEFSVVFSYAIFILLFLVHLVLHLCGLSLKQFIGIYIIMIGSLLSIIQLNRTRKLVLRKVNKRKLTINVIMAILSVCMFCVGVFMLLL